jgi:hypothetical protein
MVTKADAPCGEYCGPGIESETKKAQHLLRPDLRVLLLTDS